MLSTSLSADVPVFPNAPIREAIIDIRTELPLDFDVEQFRHSPVHFREEYPKEEVKRLVQSQLKFLENSSLERKQLKSEIEGFRYWNNEKNQVVQFRKSGFTFSRLRPYRDWDHLRAEARRLWAVYEAIAHPVEITRVATRFINSIELPGPKVDLNRYFNAAPSVPSTLPDNFDDYFARYSLSFSEFNAKSIVQFAFPHGSTEQSVIVLLDIDVYREHHVVAPFESLWPVIDQLRSVKNQIFFSYITEPTKELFR